MDRPERLVWLRDWITSARTVPKKIVIGRIILAGTSQGDAYGDINCLLADGTAREVRQRGGTMLIALAPAPTTETAPPPPPPDEEAVAEADAELARIVAGTPEKPTGNGI